MACWWRRLDTSSLYIKILRPWPEEGRSFFISLRPLAGGGGPEEGRRRAGGLAGGGPEEGLRRRGATRPNPAEASAHFRTKFAKSAEACGSMRKHAEACGSLRKSYGNPTENSVAEACGRPTEALREHAKGYGSHAEVMRKATEDLVAHTLLLSNFFFPKPLEKLFIV